MGIVVLLQYIPNDLEVLYYAVDSACFRGCNLDGNLIFSGIRNNFLENYLAMKYSGLSQGCSTKVNIISGKVYYDFALINYRRMADAKFIIRSCDGSVHYRFGRYSDRVPINRIKDVFVEGVSPEISQITPSYFDIGITAILIFGILYAFYTIESKQ